MKTDSELAAVDLAAREAAFARARERLAAARACPDVASLRDAMAYVWPPRFALVLVSLCLLAIAVLMYSGGAEFRGRVLSGVSFPLMVMAWVLLATKLWQHLIERRTPDRAIVHAFFDTLNSGLPKLRLARFFTRSTKLLESRRAPALALVHPVNAKWQATTDIDTYWHGLTHRGNGQRRALVVRDCRLIELAPDLKLARLRVAARRRGILFGAAKFLLIVAASAFPILALTIARIPSLHGYVPGATVVLLVLLLAHISYERVADRHRTLTVNKLLVKRGGQWKLFCAEWEGWEEADLSWLDTVGANDGR